MERSIEVDLRVYSVEAVKKALYRFSDRFSALVSIDGDIAKCALTFTPTASEEFVAIAMDGFRKEILDQDLREIVRDETRDVRNLILAHAFSRSGLITDEPV